MKRVLVFANGDLLDGAAVRSALQQGQDAWIVAADGGARLALDCQRRPDVVVGDMDSISAGELEALEASGAIIERHSPHKDETDLELALMRAGTDGATWVRILGAVGGRLDQTLANVHLLALPALDGVDVRMVAGRQTIWMVGAGRHAIQGAAGDTVSLLPWGGRAEGIRTEALEYPLEDETLTMGPARGISNVMVADTAHVTLRAGTLIMIHTVGRA